MRSQQEVNAIIRQLCSGLKPLFPQGSMEAILFGSYARGEADADSDIDVMVLVDSSRQDISEKTWEISSVAADLLLDRGVHRISDAIQPSHPLSSPSPLAPNPSQHQSLFQ